MKKNERAIELIEKLMEEIKAKSIGAIFDADYQMCVALEVAISRLMNDDLERGERLTRKAGAFMKNDLGKWVRIRGGGMKDNEIITVIVEKHTYKLKTIECPRCHKYDQALFEEDEIGVTHECVHCDKAFNVYLEDLENE